MGHRSDPTKANAMIRLLVVDDHDVVRMGLKQVFSGRVDMEVAGEARTGEEAINLVRSETFDVALVDLSMCSTAARRSVRRWRCSS